MHFITNYLNQLNKHIHIICPGIPHPSSTGDMADTYYQLAFLQQANYNIILHCFHDNADAGTDTMHLKDITAGIHIYERNEGHKGISMCYPYCISSRSNPRLLQNVLEQACPVLFQGMRSTFWLPDLASAGYKTFVRINGIASDLYQASTRCEKSLLKKLYAFNEARLIRKWEKRISALAVVITTTIGDQERFNGLYPASHTKCIAPFIPAPAIKSELGTGMYCLYYGDMSNPENERMVHWLSENIFSRIPVPLVVANTCPFTKTAESHPESNICTVSNPDEHALKELVQKAQVVLLPRSHDYGFDKRLMLALEKGRHCICNDLMVRDTGLEKLFVIANGCNEITRAITHYFSLPFTDLDIRERTHVLSTCYFPRQAVNNLIDIVEQ